MQRYTLWPAAREADFADLMEIVPVRYSFSLAVTNLQLCRCEERSDVAISDFDSLSFHRKLRNLRKLGWSRALTH